MVRLKYRYLLLNILYPSSTSTSTTSTTSDLTAKPKTILPTYLTFHAPTPHHINAQLFLSHLRSHITLLFGDHGLGVSQSSLKLVYFSQATSTAILRVPRSHFRITWAACTYMNELPAAGLSPAARGGRDKNRDLNAQSKSCVVRVVRVSGTIRKCEEELLRRGRREVVRAKLLAENGGAGGVQSNAMMSIDHETEVAGIEDVVDDGESDSE